MLICQNYDNRRVAHFLGVCMAWFLPNKARNVFMGLLNLPINLVRAVSGLIVGIDIFIFTCKVRFIKFLNRQQEPSLKSLVLGLITLDFLLTLGLSLIIPPAAFFWLVLCYRYEVLLLARLTYVFTSLTMTSIQNGLQFAARKTIHLIVNYPKLTIATMLLCVCFPGIVTGLFSTLLSVSSLVGYLGLCLYLYEPQVSIFQLPIVYARKLSAVQTVEEYVNFIFKSGYYFLLGTRQNEEPRLDTYLRHIHEDDAAYFFHNAVMREGRITLNSKDIDDAQIAELMQDLANKPHIAKYIKTIELEGNNISSITIPSTLSSLLLLNLKNNKLKHIELAEGLTNLKLILLNDNCLKEVNIPAATLDRLEVLRIARNPLTDAMQYSLQQLQNRFPNLEITGNDSSESRVINETVLQQHVDTLVPYSLQPPEHLNVISKEARQHTFLVTTWMERQSKNKSVNNEALLCNKIISYLYAYPITPQQAITRISKSLGMIKSSVPQEQGERSHEIAIIDGFTTKLSNASSKTRQLIEEKINGRFNAAITRDVTEVTGILQLPHSSLNNDKKVMRLH